MRRDIEQAALDGLVLAGVPSPTLAAMLLRNRTPVVALGAVPAALPYHVAIDYRGHMQQAVAAFQQAGVASAGLLVGRMHPAIRYRDFFYAACGETGLRTQRDWVRVLPELTTEGGYAHARALLDGADRPNAVLVADDVAARGALKAVQEMGLAVPDELKIIARSNRGGAPFDFPMSVTRLETDPMQMIGLAADMLVALMSGDPPPRCTERVAAVLVPGDTCPCPEVSGL